MITWGFDMRRELLIVVSAILLGVGLTGCGSNPALATKNEAPDPGADAAASTNTGTVNQR
jgi:hypothetical protein